MTTNKPQWKICARSAWDYVEIGPFDSEKAAKAEARKFASKHDDVPFMESLVKKIGNSHCSHYHKPF